MNSQKEIRNIKIKNQLELWLFCAIIGAVAGGLVWALLKIMAVGMNLIWEWIPEHFLLPYYTIAVSYTHLRAHETDSYLVCRLLLEKTTISYAVFCLTTTTFRL